MPSPTYVAIAKTVLTGTASTVTFTGIDTTYTDLVILCSARDTGTGADYTIDVRLNGNTNADFSTTNIESNGSTVASGRWTSQTNARAGMSDGGAQTASTFGSSEIYFPSYRSSQNKVFSSTGVTENNATAAAIRCFANLKSDTAAITQIQLRPDTGFAAGSRFDLYGIKNS